nr:leucine-rich repeat domain-containing protein [uncultured Oscillibacter sp.]
MRVRYFRRILVPLILAAALTGCGGAGDVPQPVRPRETVSLGGSGIQTQITGEPIREETAEAPPAALPADPALAEVPEAGAAAWTLEDGVLTISGGGVLSKASWEEEYHDETVRSITKVLIGNGIVDLPYSAFGDHDSLVSAAIGDGLTYIPSETFIGCTSLKEVRFGANAAFIDGGAFERCGLEEIAIPDTVTFINIGAFAKCEELEKIWIPASVTEIGEDAFEDCGRLTIFAPGGSRAEAYARENGIPFSAVDP